MYKEQTEHEKRWRRVNDLYSKYRAENANESESAIFRAIGKDMKMSPSTVRDIVNRERRAKL